jgi:hypothetical protein
MPAQSPTLSPTLSAMVAGLRGSSSGMPASTLPTRSPPTSAPLVKMPPPRRAKIEISEAPKESATSASMTVRLVGAKRQRAGQEDVIEGDAEQAETRHQHAGDRARLEGEIEPPASDFVAAWAVRTLARTDTFMPMKPAAPDSMAPMAKPMAECRRAEAQATTKMTTPTMAMVVYWRLR